MKRKSHAELTAEVARLQSAESLLHAALHLVNNTRPDATERAHIEHEGRYTLSLYGSDRACGGIVIQTYRYKQQIPQTDALYLDDMLRNEALPSSLAVAINRLRIVRDRILNAPAA